MQEKVKAYLGFCLKARKISMGAGTVDLLRKDVFLILVCSSASENTFKLALKYKNRFSCPLMVCSIGLENVVHKQGCKIAAVRDRSLASAICENQCEEFRLCDGRQ